MIQRDFRIFDFFKKLAHLGAQGVGLLGAEIRPREKFADRKDLKSLCGSIQVWPAFRLSENRKGHVQNTYKSAQNF